MARTTAKVTVKKTSNGGKKKPIKPTLGTGVSGGLFHSQIRTYIKDKKNSNTDKKK